MRVIFTVIVSLFVGSFAMAHGHGHDMDGKFKKMDTDKDGKISVAEHDAGAAEMFKAMDGNADGRVTVEEMQAAHKTKGDKGHHMNMAAPQKLALADANADKVITTEEHATATKNMFKEMDTDKDGFLTTQEMKTGHEKKMKK